MTATGVLLALGVPAWCAGSALLRVATLGWFVFAGVGLLLTETMRARTCGPSKLGV